MTKGEWYLNVTTREGRLMRQLTEAVGAKRVVEIGTSSGYSTIWLALGARASRRAFSGRFRSGGGWCAPC